MNTNDEQYKGPSHLKDMDYSQEVPVIEFVRCNADQNHNVTACYKALESFHPIAPPELMRELTEAVDRHAERVRKASGE